MKKKYFRFLALAILFPTVVAAQVNLPFTEDFNVATLAQLQYWDVTPASLFGIATNVTSPNSGPGGSLMFNFYNSQGQSTYNAKSPLLDNTNNSPISVTFDFAAANRRSMPGNLQTVFPDDHILLEYSTDGGLTYSLAHDYEIGQTGELNTGGTISAIFSSPTASQWVTKSITLPAGSNMVNFKGFRNNVNLGSNFAYLDHVIFQACNTAAPTGNSTQSFCNGQTVGDLMSSIIGSNIQWYPTATGGSALSNTTPLVSGTAYYASQTVNGCESTTRFPVTAQLGGCLSTDEVSYIKDFNFYPNPVDDVLFINSKLNVIKAEIYSADGRLVQVAQDKQIVSIGMSRLVKGTYFIEFTFQNGKKLQHKIIKK